LDEVGGSVANDDSGNGNHGSLLNGVAFATGRDGNGSVHTGAANQHIRVPNSASINTATTQLTLSAWVRASNPAASFYQGIVTRQFGTSFQDQWYLSLVNGRAGFAINTTVGGAQSMVSPAAIAVNQWTHLTGTWDGTTMRLYVDGVQVATRLAGGTLVATANPITIGANQNDATANAAQELFRGNLDGVMMANRAFTPTEVTNLASNP